jgi:hypothetical protein
MADPADFKGPGLRLTEVRLELTFSGRGDGQAEIYDPPPPYEPSEFLVSVIVMLIG